MEFHTLNVDVNPGEPLNLYFLGDFHEGNANSNKTALKQAVEMIKKSSETSQTYWICMGDTIDAIINSQDKRFNPSEIDKRYTLHDLKNLPKLQVDTIVKMLEPIKKQCACCLIGNHEEEYIKRHSFDIYDYFASNFPFTFKMGYVGILRIAMKTPSRGATSYDIAINHGDTSSGTTPGAPINKMHQITRWYDVNATVMAHTHRLKVDRQQIIKLNRLGTDLIDTHKLWGMTGCFLNTYQKGTRNYFEHKGAAASDIGMLHLQLKLSQHKSIWETFAVMNPIYLV